MSGAKGQRKPAIAKTDQQEKDPAFSFDGTRVAFTSEGQVFLRNLLDKDATPQALTKEGERFRDLAWAPTTDVNTLAMIKSGEGTQLSDAQTSLCFGAIGREGMETNCKDPSENVLGRKINWSPDGKTLLVFGGKPDGSEIGMIELRQRAPVLGRSGGLGEQGLRHRHDEAGPGRARRRDLPRRQAARGRRPGRRRDDEPVHDQARRPAAAEPEGQAARRARVQGDLAWRTARQLVVIRSDACLGSDTGELLRVSAADPTDDQQSLGLTGDNATFQPLSAE